MPPLWKPALPALLSSYNSSPSRNLGRTSGPNLPRGLTTCLAKGHLQPSSLPAVNCYEVTAQLGLAAPAECPATSLRLGMRRVQDPAETSISDQENTRLRSSWELQFWTQELMGVVVHKPVFPTSFPQDSWEL